MFSNEDTSLPRLLWFSPRFTTANDGYVWMLIKGYINQLCGEIPIDLRMGIPAPTTNFDGLTVTPSETQRKATIKSIYQTCPDARELEEWLKAQPQRFAMLRINADSWNAVMWVTSTFSRPLNILWLNRKQHVSIPDTFDALVADIRKTSLLPNIRDNSLNALLGLKEGTLSYATSTQMFNGFYEGPDNLLRMIFSVFDSSMGCRLISNFRL
jgi:hypothetical protein